MAGFNLKVSGASDLFALAAACRREADKGLSRNLDKGMRAAANEVVREVREHTDDYMPKGYERELADSLQSRVEQRAASERRVSVVMWALGRKGQPRKVDELEAGKLKHPVYGRTRRLKRHWIHKATSMRNPWVLQRIRPHWFTEPGNRAMPRAVKKVDEAVRRVAARIERA